MFVAPAERGQRPRVTEKTFGAVSGATRGNGTEMKAVNQAFEQKKKKTQKKKIKKKCGFSELPLGRAALKLKRRPSTAEMNAVNQPFAKKKKQKHNKKKKHKKNVAFQSYRSEGRH